VSGLSFVIGLYVAEKVVEADRLLEDVPFESVVEIINALFDCGYFFFKISIRRGRLFWLCGRRWSRGLNYRTRLLRRTFSGDRHPGPCKGLEKCEPGKVFFE